MSRKTAQLIAFIGLIIIVIAAVWYQFTEERRLRTTVLEPTPPIGYGYPPEAPPTPTLPRAEDLQPNPPLSSTDVVGIPHLRYLVAKGKPVTLDGLQVPAVTSLATRVRWIPDVSNFVAVQISPDTAARAAFMAPDKEGELKFSLRVERGGEVRGEVAVYIFKVVDPLVIKVDFNGDGKYDFKDFTYLVQHWSDFPEAERIKILAIILSEWQ